MNNDNNQEESSKVVQLGTCPPFLDKSVQNDDHTSITSIQTPFSLAHAQISKPEVNRSKHSRGWNSVPFAHS